MASNKQKSHAVRAYGELVDRLSPKSEMGKGMLRAFWVGGVICMIGQGITDCGKTFLSLDKTQAGTLCSVVLIFLSALLTGIGLYDRIGKYAGAGSIVPITGFANSVAAPAIEFRREGLVLGVGAKLFAIAGPVLTYGIASSMAVGLVFWIIRTFF